MTSFTCQACVYFNATCSNWINTFNFNFTKTAFTSLAYSFGTLNNDDCKFSTDVSEKDWVKTWPVAVIVPSEDILIEKFTKNPRKILGLEIPKIEEGSFSLLTVLDEEGSWDYNETSNLSKSSNSPWMDWSLKGKVSGVVFGSKTNIN